MRDDFLKDIDENNAMIKNENSKKILENDKGVKFYAVSDEFTTLANETVEWEFHVKKASTSAIDRIQAQYGKKKNSKLNMNFCLDIIWPGERQEFQKKAGEYPGIANKIVEKVLASQGYTSGN